MKRLIDLDQLNLPGKTMITKILDRWEKSNRLSSIKFPISEYDVIIFPGKNYVEVRLKDCQKNT